VQPYPTSSRELIATSFTALSESFQRISSSGTSVRTDQEKELSNTSGHMKKLISMTLDELKRNGYPHQSISMDRVRFASEEEIERAGGYGYGEFFQ
jgi:hypothetical protein